MTRRSRREICLEVLWIIKKGASKPTHIMYGANLSWRPLQRVLKLLVSRGLIVERDTRSIRKYDRRTSRHYEITRRGENVLRYDENARELFELEEASTIQR
ncbi:MAG: winged helix-turn-helix domain-containing protein [Candidatus Bathyarchaeia archaeon]